MTTSGTATLAVGDVYNLKNALGPRWQPRASWLASPTYADKLRRLVGPGNTTERQIFDDGPPATVLRRPIYESSGMTTAVSSGSSVIAYGDFASS